MMERDEFERLLGGQEEPTLEDAKEVRLLLGNKSLLKVLGRIQRQAQDLGSITTLDLTTEEGLNKSRGVQGQVRGLFQALDMVHEIAMKEEEDEN